MIEIIFIAISLVIVTFLFHYRVLLWLSIYPSRLNLSDQLRVLMIILVLFFTHVAEIGFYAAAYGWSIEILELGSLQGIEANKPMEILYFSSVMYTSLGLGDIFPDGHIRFLTGIEALNGLLLISWSASFTFLAMGRLWPWTECCEADDESKEGK
jgi:heme/copper-type cytochrome/quinol oxidase subunit 2